MKSVSMLRARRGASSIEYCLLCALLALPIIGATRSIGTGTNFQVDKVLRCLDSSENTVCGGGTQGIVLPPHMANEPNHPANPPR